ncbi:hypothetical protein Ndes2526B_g06667 [Nannochloris sp. 'desiccata']|nr:hypothetical protein KSW81_008388 [Chlorella desiccata (nom. nud.)]KAH7619686.1 putative FAD synthase [Chlorella desiccata (nom. nud.)]
MEVWDAVVANNDDHLRQKVEKSIEIIERTLDLYEPGGVAFSFNGGKDSTVLLHLIRAALARRQEVELNGIAAGGLPGVCTFFFHNDADFEEITSFTHHTNEQYNLDMTVLYGDFKTGLETFLVETSVRAILLGTRRGDPNAPGQETFCPSSKGWPAFMRVNPILEWTYHDVWLFLRCASLPYCSLYDRGYTSVGSVSNTNPNSALAREDGTFAPAHMLPDARLERAGRGRGAIARTVSAKRGANAETCTVGILIIGDEILSAKVDDVNMKFLCGELRTAAFFVDRAMFVRDDTEAIAAAVREFSEDYDAVITAGGLGPTPDDVTCLGIAEAFGRQVGRHPELEARIRAYFGADVTDAHLKMADAPTGPEIALIDYNQADGTVSPFPLLKCRNVYVLPGVPSLVQQKWKAVKRDLMSRCGINPSPYHSVVLRLKLADEATVAMVLQRVMVDSGDQVAVGSYPVCGQSDGCEVVLSLESKDVPLLEKARTQLVELLPPGVVQSEHRDADTALNSPIDAPTVGINVGDKVLQEQ